MKLVNFFIIALSVITALNTVSAEETSKTETLNPILYSICKTETEKEADRKVMAARREATFMKRMERLKNTDTERYVAEMKRHGEYKELRGLREKDPKAYESKMAEIRKKQQAEQETAFMKRMEILKNTDPERYATEMKKYNELQDLCQKYPKVYKAKLAKIRKKIIAKQDFMKRMEILKNKDPERYASEMKRYNEYKAIQELRKNDLEAYRAKVAEFRKKHMTEYKATLETQSR